MLLHTDGSEHRLFQDERWYDLLVIPAYSPQARGRRERSFSTTFSRRPDISLATNADILTCWQQV
jgi:hypothetical protein